MSYSPTWLWMMPGLILVALLSVTLVLWGRPSWANAQMKRLGVAAGAGWAIGALSRALRPWAQLDNLHLDALVALFLLIGACLWRVWVHSAPKQEAGVRRYTAEALTLWAGMSAGWIRVEGALWSDAIGAFGGWGVVCTFVGALLIKLSLRQRLFKA